MIIDALVLLLVAAVALGVGFHGGPHVAAVLGVVGLVAAFVFFLFLLGRSEFNAMAGAITGATMAITLGTVVFGLSSLRRLRHQTGPSASAALWNGHGVALSDLDPQGTVRIAGETWSAESDGSAIRAGTAVIVVEINRLHLKVTPDPLGLGQDAKGA